ncbi:MULTISPECIES: TIGR03750 family conjugal transfer protein [Stutzerimonas]|uniref:TIGR03750 family conjugal transfer protein n=1 Tax=Stutzerimonas zhaodongensis TaxID=1176257 RepID=A0ABX8J0B5_9GAMM|nr:TIGR03750 family conjugal transfer protein [Stutzerimonas zhaodongensis]QWV19542.1 TIGR03750 family conjugal transfer protein [Stutzerimonas zhaodongensis]
MTDSHDPISFTSEGTVNFLPNRLNRQPIVVLGLTANELFFVGLSSAIAGLVLGVPFAIVFSSIAMVPTVALVAVFLGIGLGGRVLRRVKRGRPDDWFYRNLQWRIANRFPLLMAWTGGQDLITRSGGWYHRRGER